MGDKPTIHDYGLSLEELAMRYNTRIFKVDAMKKKSVGFSIEDLEKANYFNLLILLKSSYNHPYDAKIYEAEDLASKNKFIGAVAVLMDVQLEYLTKNVRKKFEKENTEDGYFID